MAFLGCNSAEKQQEKNTPQSAPTDLSTKIDYATGFNVKYENGYKWVEIPRPYQEAKEGFKYLLVQKGQDIPEHDVSVQVISIPLETIICTSTSHIPLLDYLNETEKLIGFPSTQYISSSNARKLIDAGKVTELGIDSKMNIEKVIELDAEMVMGYSITGDYGQFRKLQQAGIPVVINAEYIEEHPLGRAEWIKFMALFFNKEKMADSVFNEIKYNYLKLKNATDTISSRPTVYSGVVYGDAWFLPGGQNNMAKLFKDAGAKYLWSEDNSTGYLEYSFESVYEKAHNADFWVGVASYNSLEEIKQADKRYTDFEAFQNGNVYSYNARMGPTGGNEFLELGYLRPDLILEDLIKIFHPELLEDEELYFHRKVE
ncbi:periplasmic binding protein [Fulvivirga imtechensis AK7]|uniref:Periplasmic binding protein n=2 Tax=Fulvivirga TaxID=396811 RepID=L8JPI4_9BACT|nr:periplasmic binding protein [Fulvivirga imtechensis AK7]